MRERGYRIIEDFDERLEALTRAWSLARTLLVVSVMLANQNDPRGQRFRDGVMIIRGTFQKYFSQREIKARKAAESGAESVIRMLDAAERARLGTLPALSGPDRMRRDACRAAGAVSGRDGTGLLVSRAKIEGFDETEIQVPDDCTVNSVLRRDSVTRLGRHPLDTPHLDASELHDDYL